MTHDPTDVTAAAAARIRRLPPVLALARARVAHPPPGNVVADLKAGLTDAEAAARHGLPLATVAGVRGFYDLIEPGPRVCDGTSCHFNGGEALTHRLADLGAGASGRPAHLSHVRCLGHCYAAPSFQTGDAVFACPRGETIEGWLASWGETGEPAQDLHAIPRRSLAESPVVLRNLCPERRPAGLEEYELPDGDTILLAVEKAKLNGRGGAFYPTAAKWRAARLARGGEKWVVANGDEGDPGSYVDRLLIEEDPHAILAGMLACARAVGARRGIVYVRSEYPRAQRVMREAIREARAGNVLGREFDVEVVAGAGSYVCGEETALLRSIEGLRGEPMPKPPYPAERGLWGQPTVVQNVETLTIVPWAVRHAKPSGTKVVSLAGALRTPGAVEVPLGMPLRRVLEQAGGGPLPGRGWRMALVGGPMGRVLPERLFDTPLSYEALPGLGHAGIVVLDQRVSPRALAEHLFAFARAESCGNCTPCRVGTARLAGVRERATLERLLRTMETGSLCGFGQGVPRPVRDLLEHWGDEVLA